MNEKIPLPPAFVVQTANEYPTLRDQFAMAALTTLGAQSPLSKARQAYEFADAMLEARKEKK